MLDFAPATLKLRNTSSNADTYVWTVNGEVVSESKEYYPMLKESGRYRIALKASKNGETSEKQQEVFLKASDQCRVLMETSAGDMIFELLEETPMHLENFSKLIESGYYSGLLFHRVIDDFMIQGGDNKTRSGGKRYKEPPTVPEEIITDFPHYRGALAAARLPDDMNPEKASSGSQFYIVDGREYDLEKIQGVQEDKYFDYKEEHFTAYVNNGGAPQLDGEYTVFGYMVMGEEVLEKIASMPTDKYDRPLKDVKILNVRFLN